MKSASNTTNHTQQSKSKMFEHKIQYQLKRQENNTQNITYKVRKRRPIPFLDDFELKRSNNRVRSGLHRAFGNLQTKEKMNSHKKFEGKLKKVLKTALTMQNTRFSRLR